ncbi:hypothetical protein Tco_0856361 [Tanacetum coccineum]|uniref:Reverse transcriptase Ty1/copia-type domain-containing protein n=1 Tax=Tanacetum coccineum TaxID=301880 RepID=A0ABQ5B4Y5_9ASTR
MEDGIFFNESKYIKEMLKKFGLEDSKPMKTPMSLDTKLTKDKACESVDSTKYRGMIGNLLYLMASRPDIMFSVCLCARFQEDPKTTHLEAWSLDDLQYGVPTSGPYQTDPPCPDEIKNYVKEEREGPVTRIRHDVVINVEENQILTREIVSERYNLAYFIAKRMELVTKQPRLILPCKQKTRKDYGTRRGRSSTSSSSTFGQASSSHLKDDDNDGNDEGTSRASTPSPTRFVNSLTNNIPQIFLNPPNVDPNMEEFYSRQTEILNRQVQLRNEQHGGIRSIGKGIKNLWRKKKK